MWIQYILLSLYVITLLICIKSSASIHTSVIETWDINPYSEYCEKYAKAEDIEDAPEESSSEEELSDAESNSSDEAMAGPVDP